MTILRLPNGVYQAMVGALRTLLDAIADVAICRRIQQALDRPWPYSELRVSFDRATAARFELLAQSLGFAIETPRSPGAVPLAGVFTTTS